MAQNLLLKLNNNYKYRINNMKHDKTNEKEINEKDQNNEQENNQDINGEIKIENSTDNETGTKTEDNPEKSEEKKDNKNKELDEFVEKLKKETQDDLIKKYIKQIIETNKLKDDIKKKETESFDYIDKYKRTLAEMENLRKRTAIDKQDSLKYANFNIINDFLGILDDFQRAIESARNDEKLEIKTFLDGIEMIEKQFIDLLFKKYGTKKFGDKGDKFDPQMHQALMMEEGDFEDETVTDVFRSGYLLHDRVVRHAQVKVGKPKK